MAVPPPGAGGSGLLRDFPTKDTMAQLDEAAVMQFTRGTPHGRTSPLPSGSAAAYWMMVAIHTHYRLHQG